MTKRLLCPIAILIPLLLSVSACGGSSSNKTDVSEQVGIQAATPAPPTIALNAISYQCGVKVAHQADIIFHDELGHPILSTKTDDNGNFSDVLPELAKHVSVISEAVSAGENFTTIKTELNVDNRKYLGDFFFRTEQQNCNCDFYPLDLSDFTYPSDSYGLFNSTFKLSNDIEVCPFNNKLYIKLVANDFSSAKAAVIDVPEAFTSIKISDADFTHTGVEVEPNYSPNAHYISTVGYIEELKQYKLRSAANTQYFEQSEKMFIFPTVTPHNFFIQDSFNSHSFDNLDISYSTETRSSIDDDGNYEYSPLPVVSMNLSEELLNFADSQNLSYDFSTADERFGRVIFEYLFSVDDEAKTKFEWNIKGPITGNIPDFSFGEAFPTPTGAVTATSLFMALYGYSDHETDAETYDKLLDKIELNDSAHSLPEFHNRALLTMYARLQ